MFVTSFSIEICAVVKNIFTVKTDNSQETLLKRANKKAITSIKMVQENYTTFVVA